MRRVRRVRRVSSMRRVMSMRRVRVLRMLRMLRMLMFLMMLSRLHWTVSLLSQVHQRTNMLLDLIYLTKSPSKKTTLVE